MRTRPSAQMGTSSSSVIVSGAPSSTVPPPVHPHPLYPPPLHPHPLHPPPVDLPSSAAPSSGVTPPSSAPSALLSNTSVKRFKLDNIKSLKGRENYESWCRQVSLVLFVIGAKSLVLSRVPPDDMTADRAENLMRQSPAHYLSSEYVSQFPRQTNALSQVSGSAGQGSAG